LQAPAADCLNPFSARHTKTIDIRQKKNPVTMMAGDGAKGAIRKGYCALQVLPSSKTTRLSPASTLTEPGSR